MCGIAGVIRHDGQAVPESLLRDMATVLRHRGPDDEGVLCDGNVGIAHRRLSIIDLSSTGRQPMLTSTGRYAIVFNGEVYNFRELRAGLETQGVEFRGQSDTEVVLQAYVTWGASSFARLNGMFAFAIWDRLSRTLVLVRDRFGIKPVYYHRDAKCFAFASEIKALRVAVGREAESTELQGLAEYMYFGNSLGEHTLYSGYRRLLPGWNLSVGAHGIASTKYWGIDQIRPSETTESNAVSEVSSRFVRAVRRQLISDVPIGFFLSGGIDSTAVVAAARRCAANRLQTYTVAFDFSPRSEDVEAARRVARQFETEHHEIHVGGIELRDVLESLIHAHDGPFGDAANVPLFLLAKALNGQPRVILQGDGGDELFGGYLRYSLLTFLSTLSLASRGARAGLQFLPHGNLRARLNRLANALSQRDPAERMALLLTEEKPDLTPLSVLGPEVRVALADCDAFARYRQVVAELPPADPVQLMLYTDSQILLPDIFLEKVDRSTMASSIEIRVPFLDYDLAEYVLALSSSVKIRHGVRKSLLKQAVEGLVPNFVLKRRKAGFGVPYGEWLRGPLLGLLRDAVEGSRAYAPGLFDQKEIERLTKEHQSRRRDHSFLLWKVLNLALWKCTHAPA